MKTAIFHPLAILGLFVISSCATGSLSPAGTTAGTIATHTAWTPALKTVPNRADCRNAAAENRVSCYQIHLSSVLKAEGIDSAMAALTSLAAAEQVVRNNGHMFAHSLGLAAFTTPAELASVFSRCSPGFQSGCYHGVIQGYFLDQRRRFPGRELEPAEINSLCADFRAGDSHWLLFQCAHGLGHGFELIYAHDLPRALAGCDAVSSAWERTACYGGAFMENIVSVTNPHQTAEGIAGGMQMDGMEKPEGEMAGMDMGEMDTSHVGSAFKKYDLSDPQYPCDSLAGRYGSQCYQMQTSLVLFENHGDFAAAGKTCESAPSQFRGDCFVSLGRDANSYAGGHAALAARSCLRAAERFRHWCHVGVVRNIVDITSRPSDGFSYCTALTDGVSKSSCYSAIGEEIRLLAPDNDKRREMCHAAPPPFDGTCLYGAGVIGEPPAGLIRIP